MDKIKNISVYNSSYELIEYYNPDFIEKLSEDQKNFLLHFEDFESFGYVVFNNEIVIVYDDCNGDVINHQSMEDFEKETMNYILDEMEL